MTGILLFGSASAVAPSFLKLIGISWEKDVAKKIVERFEKYHILKEYRSLISNYWTQTKKEFNIAADKLDENRTAYFKRLSDTIENCDKNNIQRNIASLKSLLDSSMFRCNFDI
jgi:uncharacterized protein YlxP (DUF503 family)